MQRITRAELLESSTLTCAKCGSPATAYPYPLPKGSVYCPNCSPRWLQSFLEFATQNLRQEAPHA